MNLLNAPQDAVERLQSHPAARSLGPIQTWSEEQFYTVAAHAYDLPYRHITMADVDGMPSTDTRLFSSATGRSRSSGWRMSSLSPSASPGMKSDCRTCYRNSSWASNAS